MERLGIALGLLGLAVGIIPLVIDAKDIGPLIHQLLVLAAFALVVAGIVCGLAPLRESILRWFKWRFGPYPFGMIVDYTSHVGHEIGLSRNEEKMILRKLLRAGVKGKITFYGQLLTENGLQRWLTEIPCQHLEMHAINMYPRVFTYDPKHFCDARHQVGCYYDLYVSRSAKEIIEDLMTEELLKKQRDAKEDH